jgi:hypothetical protein
LLLSPTTKEFNSPLFYIPTHNFNNMDWVPSLGFHHSPQSSYYEFPLPFAKPQSPLLENLASIHETKVDLTTF